MDHSCRPNAAVSFKGADIVVRSLVDREDGIDFSSVFISYIELLECRERRCDHLRRHYYFDCACPGCPEEDVNADERQMFSVRCGDCPTGEVCMGSGKEGSRQRPCSQCGTQVREAEVSRSSLEPDGLLDRQVGRHAIEKYFTTLETVSHHLDGTDFGMDVAEFCFKLMSQSRFSPFHIAFLK